MISSQSENDHNCKKCSGKDTDDMVQCDNCDDWYHFECVHVDNTVANVSWSCKNCQHELPSAANSSTPTTNGGITSSTLFNVRYQNVDTTVFQPSTEEPVQPAHAIRNVGDIMFPYTVQTATANTASVQNVAASISSIYKAPIMTYTPYVTFQSSTTNPLHHKFTHQYSGTSYLPQTQSSSQPVTCFSQQNLRTNYLPQTLFTSQPNTSGFQQNCQTNYGQSFYSSSQPGPSVYQMGSTSTANNQHYDNMTKQRDLELQRLDDEMRLKREYLETKYKILSQSNDSSFHNQPSNMIFPTPTEYMEPTSAQLAARQAIPKHLPTFNGDPEDWPLFYSTFENSTTVAGYTNAENLIRLQACLKGKARDIVKNKLFLPHMVPEIIQTLKMCFGRPEHILDRMILKAKSLPPLKDKLDALIEYAMCVRNICATMEGCQMQSHLNNPFLVKELVEKLPSHHKLNWAMIHKDERVPVVKTFSDWLYNMAEAASTVTPLFSKTGATVNTHYRGEFKVDVNPVNKNAVNSSCVICNDSGHKVSQCKAFKNMSLNERWNCIKSNNLCRQCLGSHRRKCTSARDCGIDGCKYKHNPLLHKITNADQRTISDAQNTQANSVVNAHRNSLDESQPYFRIIPINIHTTNKKEKIFAFLDEGSAVTLMEKSIFDELGLEGNADPLCLRWTGDTTRMESDSIKANLTISNINNNKIFHLNGVHTVTNLGLPSQSIDAEKMVRKYPHLKNLPIKSYHNVTPSILIGADNWKLAVPLKIKEGAWHQPIATKTRLGWTLQGCFSNKAPEFRLNYHTCECQSKYDMLHDMVKEYFSLEATRSAQLFSAEDTKALEILTQTCKRINNRYEVGLLWRDQNVHLPDSYTLALNRLSCLEKKFKKTPALKETIQQQINNLILKGYAKKLTSKDLEKQHDKIWYLPIFTVTNPNKPEKIRLVWDAAAKYNGASLNDFLIPGPDLLNSLLDILLKFRVGKIAICGDISEMFHRVNVKESDIHAQRFLWYDKGDELNRPSVFVMQALTFGTCCAPCIAHFIRNKNAEQFKEQYPRAVEAIQKNHYVDDFIDSTPDEEQAAELSKLVRDIHANAGFEMHNWASNSQKVLDQLQNNSTVKQEVIDWGTTTKVLGLYWDPNSDELKYVCRFSRLRRDVLNEPFVPTKRETLQVLMSVFDPLGFLSCYTIALKTLLQDIWRTGIGWDEELTEALYKKWCSWKGTIPLITAIRIPRCYYENMPEADEVQLHTFVDASEKAYAAVCYLRIKKNNNIIISLVAAKNKVAPLKPLSVPRLELQAALLGTKLAKIITQIRRIQIDSCFWWSDAKTVLKWLQMDPKNFQQFVMHRVGEILETTNIDQWKWVPSKQNPADLATKTPAPANIQLWFDGPDFLRADHDEWPKCNDFGKPDESEIKRCTPIIKNDSSVKLNIEYFSSWKRLYRAVATFILYLNRLTEMVKQKLIQKYLKVDSNMITNAKIFLFKYAQKNEYKRELSNLMNCKPIEKGSKLFTLNVYLDKYNVIRCHGREEYLNNHEDVIVLPGNHIITFLLVRYFHEKFLHQSFETAINEIRSRYYIAHLRVLFRKVRRMCQWCKNYYATPKTPQMAVLPTARLGTVERPFTFVCVDYFGPIHVAVGRRREKRWGVIFTCLTIRAIHLEIAYTLDTSSCIMAIRNFISRRGTPKEIYSDNGTNFKASEKILCGAFQNVNLLQIQSTFEQIKWNFNPPGAPHMGGAWERLVRSVKDVIYKISPTMTFNDESLKSALCEAEYIINCRPLTFVSLESSDDEAITPNHLLIGSSDGYKPIPNENVDLRQRWYRAQEFAEQFWRRWLKEYIPIISRRTKWFSKQPPIKIDDVVVIVDPNLPKNVWPKGVVIDTVMAKDGQVRRVTVKTKNGIIQRPVAKLAVLDVNSSSDGKLNSSNSFTGEGTVAANSK